MRTFADNGQCWFEFETWDEIFNSLKLKHFEEPKNDVQRLFNAQYDFIKSKFTDKKAEADLFLISEIVCKRLIKNRLKKVGYYHYTADDIQIKAEIATDYWVRRYKNNWNKSRQIYYITDGFIVTLDFAVQYALFYEGKDDMFDKLKQMESLDNPKKHAGIKMDEKSFNEWQQAFSDIEESIEKMNEEEKENEE